MQFAAHRTVVEVAEVLGVAPTTVRELIRSGLLDASRQVDRSYLIPGKSVRDYQATLSTEP